VTFDGTSPSEIIGATTFHDLNINKTGASVTSNESISMNDLVINSGVLDPGVNVIDVYGDWTNNVGDAGFIEGMQQVRFNGSNSTIINTDETFYDLVLNKTYINFDGLELAIGTSINVLHDLKLWDGTLEMNDNSTLSVLNEVNIPNGSEDQYILIDAPQEEFGNLVIDKSGGQFKPEGNIRVMQDFNVLAGGWFSTASSVFTYYFEGDFYVDDAGTAYFGQQSGDIAVFKGTNDQTVYNQVGEDYFLNIIIDKTAWPTRNFSDLVGAESTLTKSFSTEEVTESRSQAVTFLSDIEVRYGYDLVIEEGTLDLNSNTLYMYGDLYINDGGTLIVDENAELQVQDGYELEINSGGTIEILGTPGNLATVTNRGSGYYDFNVRAGGTISAEYGLFEYMSDYGVYVWVDAYVDPAHSFNYCTFQNGSTNYGSTFLHLNNFTDITITGANFPDAVSTTYNVAKTVNPPSSPGTITMDNCTGIFSGAAYEFDIYNRIDWTGLPEIDDLTIQYNAGTDEIELIWTYPQSVDHFNVYRSTDPYDFTGATVFTSPYTPPEMEYSEAATGTQYFYRVTADTGSDEISGKH